LPSDYCRLDCLQLNLNAAAAQVGKLNTTPKRAAIVVVYLLGLAETGEQAAAQSLVFAQNLELQNGAELRTVAAAAVLMMKLVSGYD
jgi:hypothetical protein